MTTSRFQTAQVSVFLLRYEPCETSADKLYLQVDNPRDLKKVTHDPYPEATCRVAVDYMPLQIVKLQQMESTNGNSQASLRGGAGTWDSGLGTELHGERFSE